MQPQSCLVLARGRIQEQRCGGMQGRMCLMLGPPGSGKSSLLKILAGKVKDTKLVKVCCCASMRQSYSRTPAAFKLIMHLSDR